MNSIYNFKTNIPQYEPKEPPKNGVRDCIDTKKAKELREHIKKSTYEQNVSAWRYIEPFEEEEE